MEDIKDAIVKLVGGLSAGKGVNVAIMDLGHALSGVVDSPKKLNELLDIYLEKEYKKELNSNQLQIIRYKTEESILATFKEPEAYCGFNNHGILKSSIESYCQDCKKPLCKAHYSILSRPFKLNYESERGGHLFKVGIPQRRMNGLETEGLSYVSSEVYCFIRDAIMNSIESPLCDHDAAKRALLLFDDNVYKFTKTSKAILKKEYDDAKINLLIETAGASVFGAVLGAVVGQFSPIGPGWGALITVGVGTPLYYFGWGSVEDYKYNRDLRRLNLEEKLFDQQRPIIHEFEKVIFDSRSDAHYKWLETLSEAPYKYDWRNDVKVKDTN